MSAIKKVESNSDFLKRFQGKSSIITKQGIIKSANHPSLSTQLPPIPSKKYQAANLSEISTRKSKRQSVKGASTQPSARVESYEQIVKMELPTQQSVERRPKRSKTLKQINFRELYDVFDAQQSKGRSGKLPKINPNKFQQRTFRKRSSSLSERNNFCQKYDGNSYYQNYIEKNLKASKHFHMMQRFQQIVRNKLDSKK